LEKEVSLPLPTLKKETQKACYVAVIGLKNLKASGKGHQIPPNRRQAPRSSKAPIRCILARQKAHSETAELFEDMQQL
jgi:hypothetical protein